MARVVLITTGRMEETALAASLRRIFPAHDFHCPPCLAGFTSAALPPVHAPHMPNSPAPSQALVLRYAKGA